MADETQRAPTAIWDLPVRIVHWSFVLLLPASWWTAEQHQMDTHMLLGQIMLGLVAFRILWGFFGSSTARFASFVKGPGAILAYLRGAGGPVIGHNPLGALSVIALLLLLAAQVGLGLFAQDTDGMYSGPLNHLVEYETGETLTERHETIFNVILGFVALHVAAIAWYWFRKRDNLVGPMVTGNRDGGTGLETPRMASLATGLTCALGAAGFSYWLSLGAPLPGLG